MNFLTPNILFKCYLTIIPLLILYSWAGGGNPWGLEREDPWMPPTHYDGMLEVVGVNGIVHLGQIQSGIRTGMRIAQGGHVSDIVFMTENYF